MSSAGESPLRRMAALVAYDGSEWFGFQVQAGRPTIQGRLEDALSTFTSLEGRVAGAGRTDTGVHARGQVVSLALSWRHEPDDLCRAWNAHLPQSIAVRSVIPAPDGFHARFSALSRTYRYAVVEQPDNEPGAGRSPLDQRYALVERGRLDVEAMGQAAALLVGTQDFRSFGKPPQGERSVRTVLQADWAETPLLHPSEPVTGRRLTFTIRADAFLQHMVRRIVGSLLEVGRGRWSVEEFETALRAADSRASAPPVSPNGLVLEAVEYPSSMGIDFWKKQS